MVATPPGDYSSEHLLYTFHGDLPGGENWSIGLRTGAAAPDPAQLQAQADWAAAVFIKYMWQGGSHPTIQAAVFNCVATTFRGCTVRALNIAGITTGQAESTIVGTFPGLGAAEAPNQIAVCVTLITPIAGRHGKGRVFLPVTDVSGLSGLTGNRLNPALTLSLAKSFADLLYYLGHNDPALADPPASFWPISVQSRTSHAAAPPVIAVQVGDVLDTIRGRRTKVKENYATATLTSRAPV